MFTRKTFDASQAVTVQGLAAYLRNWFNLLNQPGSLFIDSASIRAATGIQFPSSLMGDYEEQKTWTPTLTFGIPGDLNTTPIFSAGYYHRIGSLVIATFRYASNTFTYTTSAGNLRIAGLPYAANNNSPASGTLYSGSVILGGWTGGAGYSYTHTYISPGAQYMEFFMGGSGVAITQVTATQVPSGNAVRAIGNIVYPI